MATMCINYNFFLSTYMQAHSGCLRSSEHDGLYPDLSPFRSLRRELAGSAPAAFGGSAAGCHSCERRPSLSHRGGDSNNNSNINSRTSGSDATNNNNISSSSSNNDDKYFCSSLRNHHLCSDWRDEDKAHSNMFSFQNCTLQSEAAGNGDSYWVSFEEKSFCKGQAFKVYSGKMNGRGKKSGDRCVVKVFRKCMGTKSLCSCEMKKSEEARRLARAFNKPAQKRNVFLRFAATYWAPMDEVSRLKTIFFSGERPLSSKEAVLFEDDVRIDAERPSKSRRLSSFMDAKGRHGEARATELDAFTHFSFHDSGGKLVVCGLEGVHDSDGFFLKTPTIHSRAREFGNSDRGMPGIREVFSNHVCNDVCKDMRKPSQEEEEWEKGREDPLMAECATSGESQSPLRQDSTLSGATAQQCGGAGQTLCSQDSKLSLLSNCSEASLKNREIPSAPELSVDDNMYSRSQSYPPYHPDFYDANGVCGNYHPSFFLPAATENRDQPEPRIVYMHQHSLPNGSPVTHGGIQPYGYRTTVNMNERVSQDENANLRRSTTTTDCGERGNAVAYTSSRAPPSQDSESATSSKKCCEAGDNQVCARNTRGSPDSAIATPSLSGGRDSRTGCSSPMDTSLSPGTPIIAAARPPLPRRLVSDTPSSRDMHSTISARQISSADSGADCQAAGLPAALPDNPPSYIDSQIATAYWVMQRSYGSVPHPSHQPAPWGQAPSQAGPGSTSPQYTNNRV